MTLDEASRNIGRKVVFTYHHGERDYGVITSTNHKNVFVRFGAKANSESCDPERLEFDL